jgi:hypothetical protein
LARISVSEHVLARELDNESILLHLESGTYFGLDETGTRIWFLIAQHGQLESVVLALLEEYDVDEAQLRQDLLRFVRDLVSRQLLEINET